jgi:Cu/Ag efflux protein CusF
MKLGISKIALAISSILIGTAPLAAHAQTSSTSVTTDPGKIGVSKTVTMTATVVSIDMGSRDLLLIDSQGKMHQVNVSDQARNLDQVKVGDKVTAEYTEAISLQLKKRGTVGGPPASAQQAMIRSPAGTKPGGAVGRKVTAFATVVTVNSAKQLVTLRGPLGNEYDVQVLDPAQLQTIKKGDEVEVVYTEAVAISVQSAPGPK